MDWKSFYRELSLSKPELLKINGIHPSDLDIDRLITRFTTEKTALQDVSVNPSANTSNNRIPRVKYEVSCVFMRYLTYKAIYEKLCEVLGSGEVYLVKYGVKLSAKELLLKLLNGELYLHDASAFLVPYCLGVDFGRIIDEGFKGDKIVSLPPKRPSSFINLVKETIIELSNEFAGAIAFPTLLVSYTYMYLKYYGLDVDAFIVTNDFQNLTHTINKEMRNGVESPFTNLSFFDRYIVEELVEHVYPHYLQNLNIDKEVFIQKVMEIQEIVLKFYAAGDPVTKGLYPFPVLTANFSLDEDGNIRDLEFLDLVSKYNSQGMLNIYCAKDVRKYSMCCRFQPDYSNVKFDSFGNGGLNVGSIKVVTINLFRVGLDRLQEIQSSKLYKIASGDPFHPLLQAFKKELNDNQVKVFNRYGHNLGAILLKLYERMVGAKLILDVFRELLKEQIKENRLKYFSLGWFDLDKHFYSTIGFIGLWELVHLFEGVDTLEEYANVSEVILLFLDFVIREFNKEHKWKYNLEQVPGERLASFFPELDRLMYGSELVPYQIYANQFVPLYEDVSILDKIKVEARLFKYLSGGGISHLNIAEKLNPKAQKELIQMVAKLGVEHFAFNPVFSICERGHFNFGKGDRCRYCGCIIVDFVTRVVGFFTKVSKWTKARREWEFPRRQWNKL